MKKNEIALLIMIKDEFKSVENIIKTVEGVVSLGAELMDAFELTENAAAKVEQVFDTIKNRLPIGRITGGRVFPKGLPDATDFRNLIL